MDYHSLPRRELQSLCKKHGIPANTTNLQMASSLSALLNHSSTQPLDETCPSTPLPVKKQDSVNLSAARRSQRGARRPDPVTPSVATNGGTADGIGSSRVMTRSRTSAFKQNPTGESSALKTNVSRTDTMPRSVRKGKSIMKELEAHSDDHGVSSLTELSNDSNPIEATPISVSAIGGNVVVSSKRGKSTCMPFEEVPKVCQSRSIGQEVSDASGQMDHIQATPKSVSWGSSTDVFLKGVKDKEANGASCETALAGATPRYLSRTRKVLSTTADSDICDARDSNDLSNECDLNANSKAVVSNAVARRSGRTIDNAETPADNPMGKMQAVGESEAQDSKASNLKMKKRTVRFSDIVEVNITEANVYVGEIAHFADNAEERNEPTTVSSGEIGNEEERSPPTTTSCDIFTDSSKVGNSESSTFQGHNSTSEPDLGLGDTNSIESVSNTLENMVLASPSQACEVDVNIYGAEKQEIVSSKEKNIPERLMSNAHAKDFIRSTIISLAEKVAASCDSNEGRIIPDHCDSGYSESFRNVPDVVYDVAAEDNEGRLSLSPNDKNLLACSEFEQKSEPELHISVSNIGDVGIIDDANIKNCSDSPAVGSVLADEDQCLIDKSENLDFDHVEAEEQETTVEPSVKGSESAAEFIDRDNQHHSANSVLQCNGDNLCPEVPNVEIQDVCKSLVVKENPSHSGSVNECLVRDCCRSVDCQSIEFQSDASASVIEDENTKMNGAFSHSLNAENVVCSDVDATHPSDRHVLEEKETDKYLGVQSTNPEANTTTIDECIQGVVTKEVEGESNFDSLIHGEYKQMVAATEESNVPSIAEELSIGIGTEVTVMQTEYAQNKSAAEASESINAVEHKAILDEVNVEETSLYQQTKMDSLADSVRNATEESVQLTSLSLRKLKGLCKKKDVPQKNAADVADTGSDAEILGRKSVAEPNPSKLCEKMASPAGKKQWSSSTKSVNKSSVQPRVSRTLLIPTIVKKPRLSFSSAVGNNSSVLPPNSPASARKRPALKAIPSNVRKTISGCVTPMAAKPSMHETPCVATPPATAKLGMNDVENLQSPCDHVLNGPENELTPASAF